MKKVFAEEMRDYKSQRANHTKKTLATLDQIQRPICLCCQGTGYMDRNIPEIASKAIAAAVQTTNLSAASILSNRRYKPLIEARRMIAVYLRSHGWALQAIGVVLGGQDHTTVLSNINKHDDDLFDSGYKKQFEKFMELLK